MGLLPLALMLLLDAAPVGANVLTVAGDIPRTGSFSRQEVAAFGAQEVPGLPTRDGGTGVVRGVPLLGVLRALGYQDGPKGPTVPKKDKHSGYRHVVVVTAADGYQAVFSCAELDPGFGPTSALLVFERDGIPLPDGEGPFRLLVPTDKGMSRAIHGVVRLDVVDVRKVAPVPRR